MQKYETLSYHDDIQKLTGAKVNTEKLRPEVA